MAKMFYTIEEVCEKMGKSEEDIREMARTGELQEFRDRDKLMFKVEQIDLLVGGDEDSGEVHLDLGDSSGEVGMALSDDSHLALEDSHVPAGDSQEQTGAATGSLSLEESRLGLEESKLGLEESREATSASGTASGTGISVFDTDHGLTEAASEQTQTADAIDEELTLESVGSGSGLLDLTRESDDTSLGAELLEEVYSGDDNIEIPASASGLFEAAGAESPGDDLSHAAPGGAAMPMVIETYDGAGSGLGVGMMIGAMAALVCVAIVTIVGLKGATPQLAMNFAGNIYVWAGALLGGTIIFGLVGLFIGKASE